MANYVLNNFVRQLSNGNIQLFDRFDINQIDVNVLIITQNYVINNYIRLESSDNTTHIIDFSSNSEAIMALAKLQVEIDIARVTVGKFGATGPQGATGSDGLTGPTGPQGPTGSVLNGTGLVKSTGGTISYITDNSNNWNIAYDSRISSLTTIGNSGSATFSLNILNIPNYTLSGLGGQPQLNGTGFIKITGTAISYDNSIYLTTTSASNTYVPLTRTVAGFTLSSDIVLANLTTSDTTLILSGTYNGSINRTISINLGNTNSWTSVQTFSPTISTTSVNGLNITPSYILSGSISNTDLYINRKFTGTTTGNQYLISANNNGANVFYVRTDGKVLIGKSGGVGNSDVNAGVTINGGIFQQNGAGNNFFNSAFVNTSSSINNVVSITNNPSGNSVSLPNMYGATINASMANLTNSTNPVLITLLLNSPTLGSGSTLTTSMALQIPLGSVATNNIGILLGNSTPTGNWSIYNVGSYNNYFASKLLIGTTTDSGYTAADFNGTVRISGRLDASGNITNSSGNLFLSALNGTKGLTIGNTSLSWNSGSFILNTNDTFANTGDITRVIPTLTGITTGPNNIILVKPTVSSFTNSNTLTGLNVDMSNVTTGTVYAANFIGGNVGIGLTAPAERLDVLGNIRLTASAGSVIDYYDNITTANGPQVIARIKGAYMVNHGSGYLSFATSINNTITEWMLIDRLGQVGIGTTTPSSVLTLGGNRSASAWGESGINLQTATATYTDSSTSVNGTALITAINSFGIPTLAAINSGVTNTVAATVYIAGAPIAGTNVTNTNSYSLYVASGNTYFKGNTTLSGISTIQGTTATDGLTYGSELATSGTIDASWSGTSFGTGYTHTVGSTTSITTSISAISGQYYVLQGTFIGVTTGNITISFGGQVFTGLLYNFNFPISVNTTSTSSLTITPTSNFNGTFTLSLKLATLSSSVLNIKTSNGVNAIEVRTPQSSSSLSSNIFIGLNAGYKLIPYNPSYSASGYGGNNTVLGNYAGQSMTVASKNTLVGVQAGQSITVGYNNTLLGFQAGINVTTGTITAVGYGAGQNATNLGTFIGSQAGQNITSANNTIIGHTSALGITNGNYNVIIGGYARWQTTSSRNVYLGEANNCSPTGDDNVVLGANTLSIGTITLSSSILIGSNAQPNGNTQSNQIVIGYNTAGLGSNTTLIGNSSTSLTALRGNLLLGSTTDASTGILQVTGNSFFNGKIALTNLSSSGTSVLQLPYIQDAIGFRAAGNSNMGAAIGVTGSSGNGADITFSTNGIVGGGMTERLRITSTNGLIGINTNAPGAALHVGGGSPTSSWGVNGGLVRVQSSFLNDSGSVGGTISFNVVSGFGITNLAANTASTYTNAATVYIAGSPGASTNVSITNGYSLYVAAGQVFIATTGNGGQGTGTTTGALRIAGGINTGDGVNIRAGGLWVSGANSASGASFARGLVVNATNNTSNTTQFVGSAINISPVAASYNTTNTTILDLSFTPAAGNTITYYNGLILGLGTSATNNTQLNIGGGSSLTGNWAIYNASAYNNYFASKLLIGTTTDAGYTGADINGTVRMQQQVAINDVIGNSQFVVKNTAYYQAIAGSSMKDLNNSDLALQGVAGQTTVTNSSPFTHTVLRDVLGTIGVVYFDNSANLTLFSGASGESAPYTGVKAAVYGANTGNVSGNLINSFLSVAYFASSATYEHVTGIRITAPQYNPSVGSFGGTITTYSGIYINDIGASNIAGTITNKYAINQIGANDIVYLNGSVRVGSNIDMGNGAKLQINGSIATLDPTSGNGPAWRLGQKKTATVTLVTTDYIEVNISGTTYKLALVN